MSSSTAATARQLAADARVLTALAAQVPRCPGDERGGTRWTSFWDTAAWNLLSRSRRTHQLKHYGWTPIRTADTTI